MVLDFYAFNGEMIPTDPILHLTSFSAIPVPALSATADSAWLHVSITGSGNSQVMHHTVDHGSLASGKIYTSRVRLSAAGHYSLDYIVQVRTYQRILYAIKIEPDIIRVQRNKQALLTARVMDEHFMPYTDPGKLNWNVSGRRQH